MPGTPTFHQHSNSDRRAESSQHAILECIIPPEGGSGGVIGAGDGVIWADSFIRRKPAHLERIGAMGIEKNRLAHSRLSSQGAKPGDERRERFV
jgi:hypothetical protein